VKDGGAEACTKEGREYRVPVHGEMLPTAEPLSIMYTHRSKLRGSEDRALQKNLEASRVIGTPCTNYYFLAHPLLRRFRAHGCLISLQSVYVVTMVCTLP